MLLLLLLPQEWLRPLQRMPKTVMQQAALNAGVLDPQTIKAMPNVWDHRIERTDHGASVPPAHMKAVVNCVGGWSNKAADTLKEKFNNVVEQHQQNE